MIEIFMTDKSYVCIYPRSYCLVSGHGRLVIRYFTGLPVRKGILYIKWITLRAAKNHPILKIMASMQSLDYMDLSSLRVRCFVFLFFFYFFFTRGSLPSVIYAHTVVSWSLIAFSPGNVYMMCHILTNAPAFIVTVCRRSSFFYLKQDPAGIFELIEKVGNGTYGDVWKVCYIE